MFEYETLKKFAEKATRIGRPGKEVLQQTLREVRPSAFRFKGNNLIPNNPDLSLLIYRSAVSFPRGHDPAAICEAIFEQNGWGDMWRGAIYDYAHYHPSIHETLAIARGRASVRFGGSRGRLTEVKAGDVVLIPAGTGHQAMKISADFMAVGAYPPTGKYSEFHPTKDECARALRQIRRTAIPRKDPLYGAGGPLQQIWGRK